MRFPLLWLVTWELRQTGLRSGLTALAFAVTILAMSVLGRQVEIRQNTILKDYEAIGAATFLAEMTVSDSEIDELLRIVRDLPGVAAAEAPYRGSDLGLVADTAFLVFENDKQQEFLGATTTVLGVTERFEPARDYYELIGAQGAEQQRAPIGIPLVVTSGIARAPAAGEVLIPAVVAEYVGVRPGTRAIVELIYEVSPGQQITRRYPGLHVIGAFDAIGPDEGRFAPFWRFAARGRDVLTVRRADTGNEFRTTLPVVLNAGLLRDFLSYVQQELKKLGIERTNSAGRGQLVIRASSASEMTNAQEVVARALTVHGVQENCRAIRLKSFRLRLPDRNNFQQARQEQTKFARGARFFIAMLLALIAVGHAGLQLQTVISHWHDHAILQALGFSPSQLICCMAVRLCLIFGAGLAAAAIAMPAISSIFGGSFRSFATAAGLSTATSLFAAMATLLWPLWHPPGERIRELT